MTKMRTYYARCPECGAYPALCTECGTRTTGSTPFSDWMRSLKGSLGSTFFDSQNLDYIWFQYRNEEGWFITIEEKMRGKRSSKNQRDTHGVVSQMLLHSSENGVEVETLRGSRRVKYRGHYEIIFENTTPDNSKWALINGIKCQPEAILHLLRFGRVAEVYQANE